MKTLNLENPNQACITLFSTPGTLQILDQACSHSQLRRHNVDCRNARNRSQLLELLAEALGFPDYFEANWDGLYDVLCDDAWIADSGVVLHLQHIDAFKQSSPHEWQNFYSALEAAIDYWRANEVPLWVFLDTCRLPQLSI